MSSFQAPLQPAHHCFGVSADLDRIGTVAFVRPAPARVLDDRQRRRESPGDARRSDLFCGRSTDACHQCRIMRCAEPDVVGEKRRAVDIAVAVHRVGAPDDRYLDRHVGRHGCAVEFVRQFQPVLDTGVHVHARPGAAAIEDRTDVVAAYVIRSDRADIGLGHLPDLLLQRHSRDDRSDASFGRVGRRRGAAALGHGLGRLARGEKPDRKAKQELRPDTPGPGQRCHSNPV